MSPRSTTCPPWLPRLRAACAAFVIAGLPAAALAQSAHGTELTPQAVRTALAGQVTLHPRLLVQLVVERSAEVEYGRLQVEVAKHLSDAEAALYEPVFYSSARHEERLRQRDVEERLSSFATSSIPVLDERIGSAEVGLKNRLPTGGDVSVAYRMQNKWNNIISNNNPGYHEYQGAMVLTFKQPLLRGAGRSNVETDKKVAEAESRVSALQYKQQLIKTASDALALYWQLYRSVEIQRIRQAALDNARRLLQDTESRIQAGKTPQSAIIEIKASILLREVEALRAGQGVREAQTRLATMLRVSELSNHSLRLIVNPDSVDVKPDPMPARDRYVRALPLWPAFQIAQLHAEQARLRLDFANNQRKPAIDLVVSRTNNGLAESPGNARSIIDARRYPEWFVGLNFEVPLMANRKASAQYLAQSERLTQSQLEVASIQEALANDIVLHVEQLQAAREELASMDQDIVLRTELLRIEQVRFESGMGLMSQLLQREAELNESRQRRVESLAHLGQANDALLQSDGSLLTTYGVTVKD
jgi:outer membrane protein TolC